MIARRSLLFAGLAGLGGIGCASPGARRALPAAVWPSRPHARRAPRSGSGEDRSALPGGRPTPSGPRPVRSPPVSPMTRIRFITVHPHRVGASTTPIGPPWPDVSESAESRRHQRLGRHRLPLHCRPAGRIGKVGPSRCRASRIGTKATSAWSVSAASRNRSPDRTGSGDAGPAS